MGSSLGLGRMGIEVVRTSVSMVNTVVNGIVVLEVLGALTKLLYGNQCSTRIHNRRNRYVPATSVSRCKQSLPSLAFYI